MAIISIPIELEYEGMEFAGEFSTSTGNENVWQLSLYKYSYGQLIKYKTGWQWCPNAKNMFTEPFMMEFFVGVVTALYE
jgi:hypothetical protein